MPSTPAAPLFLCTEEAAEQRAALLYIAEGNIGKELLQRFHLIETGGRAHSQREVAAEAIAGDDGIEILVAPSVAVLDADIDAGPVRNRRWRNTGALRGRSAASAEVVKLVAAASIAAQMMRRFMTSTPNN